MDGEASRQLQENVGTSSTVVVRSVQRVPVGNQSGSIIAVAAEAAAVAAGVGGSCTAVVNVESGGS